MSTVSEEKHSHPLSSVPGFRSDHPGIQIGTYVSHSTSDEELTLLQQLDVKWAMLIIDEPELHTAAYYKRCQDRLAPYGLQIYRIATGQPWGRSYGNHSTAMVEPCSNLRETLG